MLVRSMADQAEERVELELSHHVVSVTYTTAETLRHCYYSPISGKIYKLRAHLN